MKKERLGYLAALCVMTGFLLMACGSSVGETRSESVKAEDRGEPKILNVWHQWGNGTRTEALIQEAVAGYEKEHPELTITVHALSTKTYTTKISMDLVGTAEDVDVFYYQVPSMMNRLVKAGRILPLDGYLTQEVLGKIKDGRLNDTTVDGVVYGLPLYSSVFVLYCNQELFRQAQVAIPTSEEELLMAGAEFVKLGITPLAVGAQDAWLAGGLYESIAATRVGADTMRTVVGGALPVREVPGLRAAAEQMNELYEAGIFGEEPLNMTEFDAMDAFFEGHAAMFLDGTWASEHIDTSGMNTDEIEVIGFPVSKEGKYAGNYVGSMTSGSFFVNQNTALPDEAADFAIYLSEYLGTRVYESGSGLACWDADLSQISPTLEKVVALWDGADHYAPAWDTVLSEESAQIHLNECQNLLRKEADLEEFAAAHDRIFSEVTPGDDEMGSDEESVGN